MQRLEVSCAVLHIYIYVFMHRTDKICSGDVIQDKVCFERIKVSTNQNLQLAREEPIPGIGKSRRLPSGSSKPRNV